MNRIVRAGNYVLLLVMPLMVLALGVTLISNAHATIVGDCPQHISPVCTTSCTVGYTGGAYQCCATSTTQGCCQYACYVAYCFTKAYPVYPCGTSNDMWLSFSSGIMTCNTDGACRVP